MSLWGRCHLGTLVGLIGEVVGVEWKAYPGRVGRDIVELAAATLRVPDRGHDVRPHRALAAPVRDVLSEFGVSGRRRAEQAGEEAVHEWLQRRQTGADDGQVDLDGSPIGQHSKVPGHVPKVGLANGNDTDDGHDADADAQVSFWVEDAEDLNALNLQETE